MLIGINQKEKSVFKKLIYLSLYVELATHLFVKCLILFLVVKGLILIKF